jgi:hypothetical protein
MVLNAYTGIVNASEKTIRMFVMVMGFVLLQIRVNVIPYQTNFAILMEMVNVTSNVTHLAKTEGSVSPTEQAHGASALRVTQDQTAVNSSAMESLPVIQTHVVMVLALLRMSVNATKDTKAKSATFGSVLATLRSQELSAQRMENALLQMFVNAKLDGVVMIVEKKLVKEGAHTAFVTT